MVYVPQHFCVLTCAELAKLGKEVVGRSLSYLPCHVITRLHNCSCSTDRSWPFPPPVWYQVCLNFEQKFWHRIHVFCHNLGERQNFNFVVTVFSPKSQLWGDFILATNFDPVISQNVVSGIGTSEDPGWSRQQEEPGIVQEDANCCWYDKHISCWRDQWCMGSSDEDFWYITDVVTDVGWWRQLGWENREF